MNLDHVVQTLNRHEVAYLLIGGMNFVVRHAPLLTYDIDLWIDDTPENLDRCEQALVDLHAEWGPSEHDWGPVARQSPGWLGRQAVFCLTSPYGAIDVFRAVRGLDSWAACRTTAVCGRTAGGAAFWGLSDEDMVKCQMALPESERDKERLRILGEALGRITGG
jgi:hypothetical protein